MSYVNALFIRKRTLESKESNKRRSVIVSQDSSKIKETQEMLNLEKHKTFLIEESITKSELSCTTKMDEYQKQIKSLREQITHYRLHPTPTAETINRHIEEAENLHQKVLFAINDFKLEIDKQIRDTEKDTVKRFDLKLAKICNEIEDRKKKRIMELSSMENTEKKVAKDLENLRESSILIEKKNQLLEEENKRLEEMIKRKDFEYQELIQSYYYAKRRLKPLDKPQSEDCKIPKTANSMIHYENTEDKTERYENVVARLRKQLEIERKNLKSIRNAFAFEMEDRTEMENNVRRIVEEIRDMLAQRPRPASGSEERAILIDRLINSVEIASLLNRNPFQSMSQDDI
jgi:hypothetical protein